MRAGCLGAQMIPNPDRNGKKGNRWALIVGMVPDSNDGDGV